MPKIDLLPCPFCGRRETLETVFVPSEKYKFVYGVYCNDMDGGCGASTGWHYSTPEEAAKEWNTRASGWIPCSERMPEKDGDYLCVSNHEIKIFPYRNGEFYCICLDGVLRCCNSIVTHWIPIPKPPKGGTA